MSSRIETWRVKMIRNALGKELCVLIVEHDHHTAQSTAAILASVGYKSRFADNGWDAVRHAQSGKFDAIFFDDTLLCMSTHEFITNIRLLDIQTPVIVLSHDRNKKQKNEALADGATGYIVRPHHKDQLLACLREAVVPEK